MGGSTPLLIRFPPPYEKLMCELGNRTLNRIYEARVEEMGVKKPHPECSRWVRPPPTPKNKYGGGEEGGG